MPQAVPERLSVAAAINVLSRDRVGIPAPHAGPHLGRSHLVGRPDDVVDLALLQLRPLRRPRSASHPRNIPPTVAPKSNKQQIPARDLASRGRGVGERRARAPTRRSWGTGMPRSPSSRSACSSSPATSSSVRPDFTVGSVRPSARVATPAASAIRANSSGSLDSRSTSTTSMVGRQLPAAACFQQPLKVAMHQVRRFEACDLHIRQRRQ